MVRAFLPELTARPRAALLNVSSMGAFIPVPGQTVYGASKAAVKLLTEGLHAELRGTSVRVTVVFPGAVAAQDELLQRCQVRLVGACDGVEEHYYAISTERKVAHPLVQLLLQQRPRAPVF